MGGSSPRAFGGNVVLARPCSRASRLHTAREGVCVVKPPLVVICCSSHEKLVQTPQPGRSLWHRVILNFPLFSIPHFLILRLLVLDRVGTSPTPLPPSLLTPYSQPCWEPQSPPA